MAICKRCKGFTKRNGLCLFCKSVYRLADKFNLVLPENRIKTKLEA